jgi:nitrile hydratase beta subunit
VNGVHDMGGMHGFGPVCPDALEGPFASPWEGRVFGLEMLMGVHHRSNVDRFRFTLEQIPPRDYLRLSYFERWLEALLVQSRDAGVLSEADVASIRSGRVPRASEVASAEGAGADRTETAPALPAAVIPAIFLNANVPDRVESRAPRFAVGDRVRARAMNPETHTRLPRYARGREGVIARDHGDHPLPDANAELAESRSCRLYTVRFSARELWGDRAGAHDCVYLDLFDPYLDAP